MSSERQKLLYVRNEMIRRCTAPRNKGFANYGGRGITVCQRWMESADAFIEDMGERPAGGMLDRIDNNGPYSPENCRWASRTEQNSNRRNCIYAENGQTIKAYCRDRGIPYRPVMKRIRNRGWPVDRALNTPIAKARNFGSKAPAPVAELNAMEMAA